MKTKLLTCFLVVGFLAAGLNEASAQDRLGTAGSQQLLLPLTARTTALGTGFTSGLASANGLEGLDSNPALLVSNPGTNVLFSRMSYVADIGVNYFGVAQNFGANNIGLTISALGSGEIARQTADDPEKGEVTWDATFITVGGAYARQFTDRISAGVHVKYVNERLDDMTSTNVVFDAGLSYFIPSAGVQFGVSLKNFGFSSKYDGTGLVHSEQLSQQPANAQNSAVEIGAAEFETPSLLNFGVSYTRSLGNFADASLLGNFRSNSFAPDAYAAGLELGFGDIVFVRGGYEFQGAADESDWAGWGIGAGLMLDVAGTDLAVDYAYRPMENLGDVQFVTASITL